MTQNKTKIKFAILNCSFNDNVEAQIQKNQENENRPGYLKMPAENLCIVQSNINRL
jgi:hypothetical protein